MLYYDRASYSYFTPCHRKYSNQHNQCGMRAAHDGKFDCNTVENTMALLNSDWLYFL